MTYHICHCDSSRHCRKLL